MHQWKLDRLAFSNLMDLLRNYGNHPHQAQKDALLELCTTYHRLATKEMNGRYAFSLPVGGGKTSSIVAFCKALYDSPKLYVKGMIESSFENISVLVCASKVEALLITVAPTM